ncbi:MAG: hypothetical protein FWF31_10815 [Desulfobulbus sp.]|nr:hypothetical protein [Desulfobulbus sp.]
MKLPRHFAALVLLKGVAAIALSGCIGSITMGDPKWNPPALSKKGCPDLDGDYLGDSLYFAFLDFGTKNQKTGEWVANDPISNVISIKKRPDIEYKPWGKSGKLMPFTIDGNAKEFEPKKRTLVQIKEQGSIYYADSEGNKYAKQIFNMESQDAGCRNGMLVLRSLSSIWGSEFTKGSATASETEFEKLPNGYIQTTRCERRWVSTMSSEPRKSCKTQLHQSAK